MLQEFHHVGLELYVGGKNFRDKGEQDTVNTP